MIWIFDNNKRDYLIVLYTTNFGSTDSSVKYMELFKIWILNRGGEFNNEEYYPT